MGRLLDIFLGLIGKKEEAEALKEEECYREERNTVAYNRFEEEGRALREGYEKGIEGNGINKILVAEAGPAFAKTTQLTGMSTDQAASAVRKLVRAMGTSINYMNRIETNNWRKLHGKPMRRNSDVRRRKR